jgi:hypothetical protein
MHAICSLNFTLSVLSTGRIDQLGPIHMMSQLQKQLQEGPPYGKSTQGER